MLIAFKWLHMDEMRSEWQVGDVSSLVAMEFLTMNPTLKRRLSVDGFADQKLVKPAPSF